MSKFTSYVLAGVVLVAAVVLVAVIVLTRPNVDNSFAVGQIVTSALFIAGAIIVKGDTRHTIEINRQQTQKLDQIQNQTNGNTSRMINELRLEYERIISEKQSVFEEKAKTEQSLRHHLREELQSKEFRLGAIETELKDLRAENARLQARLDTLLGKAVEKAGPVTNGGGQSA